jgi:hypothetical protein
MSIQLTQNFSSQILAINNAIPSAMNRTFYVDAENGDDDNTGSSDAPFKTLKKAIDSVPVGGYAKIHILSEYRPSIRETSHIINKFIEIIPHNKLIIDYIPYDENRVIQSINLFLKNATVLFSIEPVYYSNAQLIINENNTDKAKTPYCLITSNFGNNCAIFRIRTKTDNYHPLIIKEGYLTTYDTWSHDLGFLSLMIDGHYTGTNRSIQIDPEKAKFLYLDSGVGAFYYKYEGGVTDLNGNSVNIKDVISGIIYDTDSGLPINLISNVNLK